MNVESNIGTLLAWYRNVVEMAGTIEAQWNDSKIKAFLNGNKVKLEKAAAREKEIFDKYYEIVEGRRQLKTPAIILADNPITEENYREELDQFYSEPCNIVNL